MQMSHRQRFIFIHIFKTGGTSIRAALNRYADKPERIVWNRLRGRLGFPPPPAYPGLTVHARAIEVRDYLPPQTFNDYFKFAFVRNPWDWQVSFYHYIRQTRAHTEHAAVAKLAGLEEFLRYRLDHPLLAQKAFVADETGTNLMDFVGRYENLEADFQKLCTKLGIAGKLPFLNRSRHADYRTCYTDRAAALLEQYSKDDIAYFDYRFDPVPQTADR